MATTEGLTAGDGRLVGVVIDGSHLGVGARCRPGDIGGGAVKDDTGEEVAADVSDDLEVFIYIQML